MKTRREKRERGWGGRRVRREEKLENQKSVGPRERGRCARDRDAHLVTLLRPKRGFQKSRGTGVFSQARVGVLEALKSAARASRASTGRGQGRSEPASRSLSLPSSRRECARTHRRTTLRAATFTTVFSQHPSFPSKKKQSPSDLDLSSILTASPPHRKTRNLHGRSCYSRGCFVSHMIPGPVLEIFGNFWKFCPFSAREVSRKKCAISLGEESRPRTCLRWRGGGARG